MQFVPPKKSDKAVLSTPLRKYIKETYGDPAPHEADLALLDELRDRAINSPDVANCSKYFGQLQLLSSKFPINEKGVKVMFTWHPALSKKKASSYSINLDKACTLFNLGAAYSLRAQQQNLATQEGMKTAFNFFQMAAGAFSLLQDNVAAWGVEALSSDLAVPTLRSLELLMQAQAQECFFKKAEADQKSPSILSKLGGQAADLYDQAFDAGSGTNCTGFEGRLDWLTLIQVKALYHHGMAHFMLAPASLKEMKYGEEISRLHLALSFISKALELSKTVKDFVPMLTDLQTRIVTRLRSAEKDNNTIYLETIPPFKALPPIGRHLMVKSLVLDLSNSSVIGPPLFGSLFPIAVYEVSHQYKQKKEALVFEQLALLDRSMASLSGTMNSMNLPSALDAMEQPIGLPPSLIARSKEVRAEGGASSLNATLDHFAHTSNQLVENFNEGVRLLEKEEAEDNTLRAQYGSRWVRTPSATLNDSLKAEAKKFIQTIQSAEKANGLVKDKISTHFAVLEQLGGSEQDLEKAIPSSSSHNMNPEKSPYVSVLRDLVNQAAELKKENEGLKDEMKTFVGKDDIAPLLLETYGTKTISDPSPEFAIQLRNYDPFLTRVNQNIEKQQKILAELLETNQKFVAGKTTNEFITKREEALRRLDLGYQAFKEVKANLKDGLKFYSNMETASVNFKNKCEDFCMARNTERRELEDSIKSATAASTPQPQTPQQHPGQTHPMYPGISPHLQFPPGGYPGYGYPPQAPFHMGHPQQHPQQHSQQHSQQHPQQHPQQGHPYGYYYPFPHNPGY